ncbi:MAG: cytochrome c oxidase subunit II [Chloroflexota bacterium]
MPTGRRVFSLPAYAALLGVGLILVGLGLLSGCQNSPSILEPASPQASSIANLAWLMIYIALPVFVGVELLLVYTVWRFRSRGDEREPEQIEGHKRIEILWTAAPGLVLIAMLYLTFQTMAFVLETPPESMLVQVHGHQFWWELKYDDGTLVTANEIHIPVGQSVRVELHSTDVIHSFWVPELGGKTDLVPGHINANTYRAIRTGIYRGQCAEFCGLQHAYMGFLVFVDSPTDYQAWLENERKPAVAPTTPEAQQGQQLFNQRGCANCHALAGTAARGVIGPNLTHMGSRSTIGANLLENTPDNMSRWLADPQQFKPGNLMPNLGLDESAVRQLTAYMGSLR